MSDIRLRGRDDELASVRAVVRAVARGSGAGVVVRGAPGTGRSRLLTEAVAGAPAPVLTLAGVPAERHLPGAAVHRLARLLAAPAVEVTGRSDAFALGVTVLDLLGAAAPVVCLVDDADDVDELSLAALGFAARRLTAVPAGLVFAVTPDGEDPTGPLTGLVDVHLRPLGETDSRAVLLDRLAARTAAEVPDDVLTALSDLAAGHPLALAEAADALTDGQLLGGEPLPTALPEGRMRRHHRRRLAGLDASTRELLLLATLQPLDVDTLVRAAAARGIGEDDVDRAVGSGVLRFEGDRVRVPDVLLASSVPVESPPGRRRAAHRALAAVLDLEGRRLDHVWHRAMAVPAPPAREDLCAELLAAAAAAAAAGDQLDASRCFERAAALTTRPGAAADHIVSAAWAAWLGGDARRARLLLGRARRLAGTPELRGRVDLLLGEIELRSGSADRAYQALTVVAEGLAGPHRVQAAAALLRASEMYQLANDHHRFVAMARRIEAQPVTDDDPLVRFMLEQFAGFSASFTGDHRRATERLRTAVAIGRDCDDLSALILTTVAASNLGDERLGRDVARQAVTRARATRTAAHLPVALEFLAFMEFRLDDYAAASAHAREALALARRTGQDNSAAACLAILALLSTVTGDGPADLVRAQQAARQADGRGLCRPRSLTAWAAARMALATGRIDSALAALRSMTAPDRTGRTHLTIRVLATPDLVEVAAKHGDPGCVEPALRTFESWAGAIGDPWKLGQIARCRALLATDPEESEAQFVTALAHLTAAGTRFELARTQLLHGQALRRRRRPARARRFLHEALEAFDGLDARSWAAQARAELRAAGGVPSAAPPSSSTEAGAPVPASTPALRELTPQQSEIARLVAGGATNREIAARLFLSPRTVDHHLRNIFVRLGVRSRVELTRLVG